MEDFELLKAMIRGTSTTSPQTGQNSDVQKSPHKLKDRTLALAPDGPEEVLTLSNLPFSRQTTH